MPSTLSKTIYLSSWTQIQAGWGLSAMKAHPQRHGQCGRRVLLVRFLLSAPIPCEVLLQTESCLSHNQHYQIGCLTKDFVDAVAIHQDSLYVVGSLDVSAPAPTTMQMRVFDLAQQQWSCHNFPEGVGPRFCGTGSDLASVGDQLLLFGGKLVCLQLPHG